MGEKTRDKVKRVALALFANNGYETTSMEQIATGVGIKKSSLYAFITSKEALFWEIYEELESRYSEHMEKLLTESETMLPPDRLYYLFKRYFVNIGVCPEDTLINRTFWNRIMFFPPTTLKDRLLTRALDNEMRLGEKYKEIIMQGMQQGLIRAGRPEDILLSYYSLRQGFYAISSVFMSGFQEEQLMDEIDKVWHCFWLGIKES